MVTREIFAGSQSARYVIRPSRDLYLDTGFVRARGRTLGTAPYISRCYTGALTFIELLSDITISDREFSIRRSAIVSLMNSDVVIDWQIPNRKIPAAFAMIRLKYDVFDDTIIYLQKLVDIAQKSRTRAEFEGRISEPPLRDAQEHFRVLDREIDEVYRSAVENWIVESRRRFDHPSRSMLLETLCLPASTPHDKFCDAMARSPLACQIIVYAFTELYAEREGIADIAGQEELYNSYDHSIDAYVAATSAKMWRGAARRQHPARNDGADEHHLLYIVPGTTLYTMDRKFAKWVQESGVPVRFEPSGG